MPRTTRFEIRDINPGGGYVISKEEVKATMPKEYAAFVERLKRVHDVLRNDYPALKASGRVFADDDRLVKMKFIRVHPEKDVTWIPMHALESFMSVNEVVDKFALLSESPVLAHAEVRTTFCHCLVWAGALDAKQVKSTSWLDYRDNGTLKVTAQTPESRLLFPRTMPFPQYPAISNEEVEGAVVSWKRTSDKPVIVGIAWSPAMACMNCDMVATAENACQFKMCKRCRDASHVPVWYCSEKCQRENYEVHRAVCKSNFAVADAVAQTIAAAEAGDKAMLCAKCGVAPTRRNIHVFRVCPLCKRSGHTVMYCGRNCHFVHASVHGRECDRRLFEHLEGDPEAVSLLSRIELVPRDGDDDLDMHVFAGDLEENKLVKELGRQRMLRFVKYMAIKQAGFAMATLRENGLA